MKINKIFNKLSVNKKNIAKISSGTMIGHLISLITLPILTRIYGAEVFGIWAFLNALAYIINSFSDLGMSNLLMIEKNESIKKYYKVITTISIFISTISALITSVLYYFFFNDLELNIFIFFGILFLASFFTQQIQICYTWLNRNKEYDVLMKNPIYNYSIYGIAGIILGYLGFVEYGFYIAHLLGSIFTFIHMRKKLPPGFFAFDTKSLYSAIVKNKKFIAYQVPTNITNSVKSQLPILLIKIFWGAEVLGYYAITLRILQMPVILIAKSVGRVFFQIVSDMTRQSEQIGDYVLRNIFKAMKISLVPIIILISFGDIIAIRFLGQEWDVAGTFVRILALQYFFIFIQDSVQGLAITLNKQKYALFANTSQIIALTLSVLVGKYLLNDIYYTLVLIASFTIIIQLLYFSALFKVMNISPSVYLTKVIKYVVIIISISFICRRIYELVVV